MQKKQLTNSWNKSEILVENLLNFWRKKRCTLWKGYAENWERFYPKITCHEQKKRRLINCILGEVNRGATCPFDSLAEVHKVATPLLFNFTASMEPISNPVVNMPEANKNIALDPDETSISWREKLIHYG